MPRKDAQVIDTRFTWSGQTAKEFLELVKEEYGKPIPYGAIRHMIRFACARFVEVNRRRKNETETL